MEDGNAEQSRCSPQQAHDLLTNGSSLVDLSKKNGGIPHALLQKGSTSADNRVQQEDLLDSSPKQGVLGYQSDAVSHETQRRARRDPQLAPEIMLLRKHMEPTHGHPLPTKQLSEPQTPQGPSPDKGLLSGDARKRPNVQPQGNGKVNDDGPRQAIVTIAGRHHQSNEALNEDTGFVQEWDAYPRDAWPKAGFPHGSALLTPDLQQVKKPYRVRVSFIFDGHGPPYVGKVISPGRLVAKQSLVEGTRVIKKNLSEILGAPALPRSHPQFLLKSRQAAFSNAMNELHRRVAERLSKKVLRKAGATATIVMDFTPPDDADSTQVLCCNFGDSRSLAVTLNVVRSRSPVTGEETTVYTPHSSHALSAEENIRMPAEQRYVAERLTKMGFVPASISRPLSSRPRVLNAVFLPERTARAMGKYTPFSSVSDVIHILQQQAKMHPIAGIQDYHYSPYTAYCIQLPYLYKIHVDPVSGVLTSRGLQLTGTIGDRFLEPLKRSTRNAYSVSSLELTPDTQKATFIITASDGLWDVVDRYKRLGVPFENVLASSLTTMANTPKKVQKLTEGLAVWASRIGTDDVTISTVHYPEKTVNPGSYEPPSFQVA